MARRVGERTNNVRGTHRRQEKPLPFHLQVVPDKQQPLYGQVRTLRKTGWTVYGHSLRDAVNRLLNVQGGRYKVQSQDGTLWGYTDNVVDGFRIAERLTLARYKAGVSPAKTECLMEAGS